MRSLGFILIALLSVQASAASISKCVDSQGRVTFTQNANCPGGSVADGAVRAHNPTISGSSAPVQMADPNRPRAASPQAKELTVVGQPQQRTLPIESPAQRETTVRRSAAPAQPCIKMVERRINSSTVMKNGSRRGRSEIIKVPVAC